MIIEKQSDIYMKNIQSVCQYIINKPNKVITIFGEYHDVDIPCKFDSISLAEYIKKSIVLGKKVKVIIEADVPGQHITSVIDKIGSKNIREIVKTLVDNGMIDNLLCLDPRPYFLGPRLNFELYNIPTMNKEYNYILKNYLEPFFAIQFNPVKTTPEFQRFLDFYLITIKKHFENLKKNWDSITPPSTYKNPFVPYKIELLRNRWALVLDYYILETVFTENDTTEYICLLGESHRESIEHFIRRVLNLKSDKIYTHYVTDGNCININKIPDGLFSNHLLFKKLSK